MTQPKPGPRRRNARTARKGEPGGTGRRRQSASPPAEDESTAGEPMIEVYVVERERIESMPVRQAAAGIIAYARRELGAGTPACGVWEQRAIEMLAAAGYTPTGRKMRGPS